jgi:hypothetical protein
MIKIGQTGQGKGLCREIFENFRLIKRPVEIVYGEIAQIKLGIN